jgi:hypothetical protein
MSILTADYAEIIAERKRRSEIVAKERPVGPKAKSRMREIELLNDTRDLAILDPLGEFGGLQE